MVKIPERNSGQPYLSVDYVQDSETATIVEPPYIIPQNESLFNKEQTIVTVKLQRDNDTYLWSLNQKSNNSLVKTFGSEGDNWVGKQIVIRKRSFYMKGEQREALYADPIQGDM